MDISQEFLLEKAIDLAHAKLQSSSGAADEYSGEATAAFIEIVYKKLVELANGTTD